MCSSDLFLFPSHDIGCNLLHFMQYLFCLKSVYLFPANVLNSALNVSHLVHLCPKKQVFFSYAVSRFQWGKITDAEPSRFLSEVDEEYIEFLNPAVESRFVNKSGLSSDIFGDNSFEQRAFKKIEKKKLSSSEPESLPLPTKLKPVASAKIINPSGNSSQIS